MKYNRPFVLGLKIWFTDLGTTSGFLTPLRRLVCGSQVGQGSAVFSRWFPATSFWSRVIGLNGVADSLHHVV